MSMKTKRAGASAQCTLGRRTACPTFVGSGPIAAQGGLWEGGQALAAPPAIRTSRPIRPLQGVVVSTVICWAITWPVSWSVLFPVVSKTVSTNVPL